jgi:hypothetical protein
MDNRKTSSSHLAFSLQSVITLLHQTNVPFMVTDHPSTALFNPANRILELLHAPIIRRSLRRATQTKNCINIACPNIGGLLD